MMDWGGSGFFGLGHLLWSALFIGAAIVLVRWLLRGDGPLRRRGGEDRALSILKERYARGEIDKTEFDARKSDIA